MTIIKKQAYSTEDDLIICVNDFDVLAAQDFIQSLLKRESDPLLTDIIVYVTSFGGCVSGLTAMIEAIHNCTKTIHMVGIGHNYSAGGLLVMTGPKGSRWIGENSFLHIHEIQDFIHGSTTHIKHTVIHNEMIQNQLFKLLVNNSLLSSASLKNKIKENNGEWLITPQEALQLQLVDKIGMPKLKVSTIWEMEND